MEIYCGNYFFSGGLSSGSSFSKLLRGLAAFDALFLLAAILSFGLNQLSPWYTNNVFLGGLCIMRVLFGLIHTFRIGSVYMTLAVTFERFHAIIFPLRHFVWKKFLIPTSVAIAVLYNIPKYFELEITVSHILFCNSFTIAYPLIAYCTCPISTGIQLILFRFKMVNTWSQTQICARTLSMSACMLSGAK